MSGAPFDSIRRQLGANRAAISGGYIRISPAGGPSAAPLAHAGCANLTGNRWVAGQDGCPAGRMVAFARVNEGEDSYLCLVITMCVAFGVETCSAHW
jgi:hypothetical protein